MNGTVKSISTYVGVALTVFGFVECFMGFGDALTAGWGTSLAIRGLSELLFGMSIMLFGNVLAILTKR